MGARPLKRTIDQYVVAPLAAIIVEKRFPEGEQFLFVRSNGDGIQVEFVDPDANIPPVDAVPPAAPADPGASSALAETILAPKGTQAELQMLQVGYEEIEERLQSAEWNRLKDKLSDEMASADFWSRPDRFDTLARFALMDRVKAAAETAKALLGRIARYGRSPQRYSPELSSRLALQLHLTKEGIKDAFDDAPIELALVIEPAFEVAGDRQAAMAWCRRLMTMYRNWADKRRMHVSELPGAVNERNLPILLVSGFGAHRILSPEAGLHVFEPFEGTASRVTARVRLAIVPLGEVAAAKEHQVITKALDQALPLNSVVRRYREQPPLVRDAGGKWRTGRLDLVLGGEFDLLQAGLSR